jgi:hypothetical protein
MGKKTKKSKKTPKTATKLSRSYKKFERTLQRGLNLIPLQRAVQKAFPTAAKDKVDPADLTRAAVVLSVAAMDTYFTDIFAERFIPFLKKKGPTDGICEILNDAGLTTKTALELLTMERPYRRIRTLIEQYFERHTTQKVETIDSLFLAYGIKNFSANIQKLKGRRTLLRSVELVVQRRNEIAHAGDLNAYGKLTPIDYDQMKKRLLDIVTFVSGAEEILQKQL